VFPKGADDGGDSFLFHIVLGYFFRSFV